MQDQTKQYRLSIQKKVHTDKYSKNVQLFKLCASNIHFSFPRRRVPTYIEIYIK
jgi:hypothetical protein